MFRKATLSDLDAIAAIYDAIHTNEEAGLTTIGWIRDIYPTRASGEASIRTGDMFVLEEDGVIVAAGKINQIEDPAYVGAHWEHPARPEEITVLHTLVVDPRHKGRGLGKRFVAAYEDYARKTGAPFLRMDTNARNTAARCLYKGLGYQEVGIVPTEFNGIPGVMLVCLEKKV